MSEQATVLDHGYLKVIETWGSDERIIESARMSTNKGFLGWGPTHLPVCDEGGRRTVEGHACICGGIPGDEKLLRFLWENHHSTPFEMAGATFEVQAPIFVFREWHRHRVPFGYNEMSARYTPLPDVNYIPTVERLMMGSDGKNKQAGTVAGAKALSVKDAELFRMHLEHSYQAAEGLYQSALTAGVPKELARIHLPVGRYSRMRATGNLRGWLGFMALRSTAKNPAAQFEIRQYADAMGAMLAAAFPRTMALFNEEKRK